MDGDRVEVVRKRLVIITPFMSTSSHGNYPFSPFSRLFAPFLSFFHLFPASLGYVNFDTLIRHLQWGPTEWKRVKNKLKGVLLMNNLFVIPYYAPDHVHTPPNMPSSEAASASARLI